MDKCGCCQVCGRTEHELCDLSPEEGRYGICGDNLVCRRKIEVSRFYELKWFYGKNYGSAYYFETFTLNIGTVFPM